MNSRCTPKHLYIESLGALDIAAQQLIHIPGTEWGMTLFVDSSNFYPGSAPKEWAKSQAFGPPLRLQVEAVGKVPDATE